VEPNPSGTNRKGQYAREARGRIKERSVWKILRLERGLRRQEKHVLRRGRRIRMRRGQEDCCVCEEAVSEMDYVAFGKAFPRSG